MEAKSKLKIIQKSDLFGDLRYGKEFGDIYLFNINGILNPKSIVISKVHIDILTF